MVIIDGAQGEGGGQVLRTSLALALVTQQAVRVERIRAGRAKPARVHQHLTAVQAAAAVGDARVVGAEVGSRAIELHPRGLHAGEHVFRVGTAGSATLVLQTVLPALLRAEGPSRPVLEGGTHNPLAPTFDLLDRVFLPVVRQLGAQVRATLERPGFHPAGGGRFTVEITPAPLGRLELLERGAVRAITAEAISAPPTFAGAPSARATWCRSRSPASTRASCSRAGSCRAPSPPSPSRAARVASRCVERSRGGATRRVSRCARRTSPARPPTSRRACGTDACGACPPFWH